MIGAGGLVHDAMRRSMTLDRDAHVGMAKHVREQGDLPMIQIVPVPDPIFDRADLLSLPLQRAMQIVDCSSQHLELIEDEYVVSFESVS